MYKVLILITTHQFCTVLSASILGFNFASPGNVIKNKIEQIPHIIDRVSHIDQNKQDFTTGLFNLNLFAEDRGVNEFNVFRNTHNPDSNKNLQPHSSGPHHSHFVNKITPPAKSHNNPSYNHGPINMKSQETYESYDIKVDTKPVIPVTPYQYNTVSATDRVKENISDCVDESTTYETTTSDYEWTTTDEPLNRIGGAPQAVLTSLLG